MEQKDQGGQSYASKILLLRSRYKSTGDLHKYMTERRKFSVAILFNIFFI